MTSVRSLGVTVIVGTALVAIVAGDPKPSPHLVLRATYDTGLGAAGAEIISIRDTDAIAAVTNVDGSVDILDLSDPFAPQLPRRIAIDTPMGTPNSAAIHPQRYCSSAGVQGVGFRLDARSMSNPIPGATAPRSSQ